MAAGIQFQTSFDHYTTVTDRFNSVIGSPTITNVGRNGTNGLQFASGGSEAVAVKATLPTPLGTLWFGFAYRVAGMPTAGSYVILARISDNGLVQCQLVLRSDGTIQVHRGNNVAVLGTLSGFAMLTNVYYHIEWKTVISTTVGVTQVWINEVSKISLTSQNTQAVAGVSVASEIQLCHGPLTGFTINTAADFDDAVVRDDAQIGDVQVGAYLPTGIGATNQWTPTGAATTREAVDEAAPNSDTDYMNTAVVNDLSLFTFPTIPTTSTIVAVVPIPFAKKTDAGTAKIKSVIRHSGTNYPGTEKAPSDSAYEYHPDVLMVNPGTGVAWTPANWNAPVEVGVQRSA